MVPTDAAIGYNPHRMHHSPLRYPGGKSRLVPFLSNVIGSSGLVQPHYVEPYAGGAGAAIALLSSNTVQSITINDADPRICCFWQSILRYPDWFLEKIQNAPVNIEEWRTQRDIYMRRDLRKVRELGFATFFLNRTTRSGIIHNGGPIGGHKQTGKYLIDARFNKADLIKRIESIVQMSSRIQVSGEDGLSLLKKINKQPSISKRTFVYLDPPYFVKGSRLYLNQMSHTEHSLLANYLKKEKRFPWVMTYDNNSEIKKLYKSQTQKLFYLSYSAYKRKTGEELLIYPRSISVTRSSVSLLRALHKKT